LVGKRRSFGAPFFFVAIIYQSHRFYFELYFLSSKPKLKETMKTYLPLIALSALLIGSTTSCKKKGCLDQDAVNYNSEAKKDDGTCKYTPTINVNGNNPENINVGDTYTDAGATATNKDGSTVTVNTSSQVDATTKGTYTVTYTATNENGSATATRTVNVNIGQDNWLVTWAVSSDCGNAFPLTPDPTITAGSTANELIIDNMFNLIGGTANATVNGNNISIPTQLIDVTLGQLTFSGVGSINNQANLITITYTYDNTIPIIGGSGTCVATYTKQ
jgi:PKD repeat protein